MDLTFIPISDLIKEAESRCSSFICAYELHKEGKTESEYLYGEGEYKDAVYLAACLQSMVTNNWNGEMQTLQELHDKEQE